MRHEIFCVVLVSLFSAVCYSRLKYQIAYNEVQFSEVISEHFIELTSVHFPYADKEYRSGLCNVIMLYNSNVSGFRSRRPVLSVHQQHCLCPGHGRHLWGKWSQRVNIFTAIVDLSRFNNSCLKSPASTLVDLTFQSRALRSFSLNQLRNLSL